MGEGLSRDRDASGRPRSARPRDRLGRPLPRDEHAPAPADDPPPLPPRQALAEAQQLLDDGAPFAAHEVLEAVWKSTTVDRDLWRGLAQLAVGVTHLQRGNDAGARALLDRAAATLEPWAGRRPHGIAVDELRAWAGVSATNGPPAPMPPLVGQAADDRA